MKELRFPFSAFEVFSNIIPAVVFTIGLLLIGRDAPTISTGINNFVVYISGLKIDNKETLSYIIIALSFTAIMFCIGHLLMAAGSMILDRYLIGKGIGYPYQKLFRLKPSIWRRYSSQSYLAMCSLIIIYSPILLFYPYQWLFWLFVGHLTIAIFVKMVISFIRSLLKRINNTRLGGILQAAADKGVPYYAIFLNFLCFLFVAQGILNFIRSVFRMDSFNGEFIANFKVIFKRKFHLDMDAINNIDASVFWLPYTVVHDEKPAASQSLQYIRILYYFSRTLCICFYLLFFTCVLVQFTDGYSQHIASIGISSLALGVIFYVHFYNIYFTYYSKQTFRAFYTGYVDLLENSGNDSLTAPNPTNGA